MCVLIQNWPTHHKHPCLNSVLVCELRQPYSRAILESLNDDTTFGALLNHWSANATISFEEPNLQCIGPHAVRSAAAPALANITSSRRQRGVQQVLSLVQQALSPSPLVHTIVIQGWRISPLQDLKLASPYLWIGRSPQKSLIRLSNHVSFRRV